MTLLFWFLFMALIIWGPIAMCNCRSPQTAITVYWAALSLLGMFGLAIGEL